MVRPPMGGIGVLSNLKTSNPNPTPKIPRDLDFGLLYSSYINPPPPKSPLFDSLPLRSSMRHLDTLRTHNVTPAEKEKYNITSDRVMVTSGGNVLNLCGAGVGGRFTTEEILMSRLLSAEIDRKFSSLDTSFKSLSNDFKKLKGSEISDKTDDELLNTYKSALSSFLSTFEKLNDLVSKKRKELASLPKIDFEVDPEAEMKLASPLPPYLTYLIEKYTIETSPKKPHPSMLIDSIARLSAWLTSVILRSVFTTDHEYSAYVMDLIGGSDDRTKGEEEVRTEKYWRNRVFMFLSKCRELKSFPKKEKDLMKSYDWDAIAKDGGST
ncbi:hypothetical protein TL16_g10992 [Triparma laevis f. inornata]|uniref:Uncharacterized protein n=2 Tax=Triparma laevis TaxID=1534972 RepID=A0A9W7AB18_9STRA|nr:hypothetical protein TrLO_g8918 [Triparma laevis f. longispina]GMH87882.1 hypothetical protein TL16_g10992 [Triparma laevis f. inornata]